MSLIRRWKTEEIAFFFLGFFICFCFLVCWYAIGEKFAGKQVFHEGSFLYLVCSTLPIHGSILFGVAFCFWFTKMTWQEAFGFLTPPVGRAIAWGAAVALVFLPAGLFLQTASIKLLQQVPPHLLQALHISIEDQAAVDEFKNADSNAGRLYLAVFAIVIAPVAEEVLFRGMLFRGLKQVGYPWLAYWGSAFLFAAIHLNAPIFLPILLLGLLLAWLYEKFGNLLASITTHCVFNAINVGILLFGDNLAESMRHHFHWSP